LKKRWDLISKFGLHPGVLLMVILCAGWYVIAVTRGGEGFFDRQIIEENLSRFAGGSGHSHSPYYYIPYLFALGLPWSLFLPFLTWDFFQRRFSSDDDSLFLALWFLVMFVFFSISMGKRPVYILPIYPALSLLMALWFYRHGAAAGVRRVLYRFIAALAGAVGLTLIIITVGTLWSHDPGWFFSPVERLLKAKDRANLLVIKSELATFGWSFTVVSVLSGFLWFSLGCSLWLGRLRSVAWQLVLIAVPVAFITRAVVMPVIAEAKSYRAFMAEVNQLVKPNDHLYLYGDSFNSDPLVFYRGEPIDTLKQPEEVISNRIGAGDQYVIMSQKEWRRISDINRNLPPPLLKSEGKGPEGDAPLVLFKGKINFSSGDQSSQNPTP